MIFILRVLHHNELELTASKASLEYMKGAVDELTNSRNERLRAREILLMKHKKIEDFEKLAVSSGTQTGQVYFSFRSFRKHWRARERKIKNVCKHLWGRRGLLSRSPMSNRLFSSSPTHTLWRWQSIKPPRFLFFITHARRTLKRKYRDCEQAGP